MSKVHAVVSKGTTERYSEAVNKLNKPGEYIQVVRGLPRSIVMVCPDGCGENITINLDQRSGKAWRTFVTGDKLTIYPSVWRDTGCRAHFIVWKDHVIWCGYGAASSNVILDETLINLVLSQLSVEHDRSFELIAENLNIIPWEALWACKELVHRDMAIELKNNLYRKLENKNTPTILKKLNFWA